jgi:hypothetical protein
VRHVNTHDLHLKPRQTWSEVERYHYQVSGNRPVDGADGVVLVVGALVLVVQPVVQPSSINVRLSAQTLIEGFWQGFIDIAQRSAL